MIKNTLRLLAIITALFAFTASAQKITGSWSLLPSLGTDYSDFVETPERTFVLADGSLMALDNEGETYYFNCANKLSDSNITRIRYNFDKGYLFIAYANGNIDLLYDDDHVVNMPEFKDAVLTTSHTIGDIAFGADRIAITTDFGIVVFNDERHEVVESGMYNQKVDKAMILGDRLIILTANNLLWSPLSTRHVRLDNFDTVKNASGADVRLWPKALTKLNETQFINSTTQNELWLYTFDGQNGTVTYEKIQTGVDGTTICHGKDFAAISAKWNIFFVDRQAKVTKINIPTELRGTGTYSTTGSNSIWIGSSNGISHYDFSNSASSPTVLSGPFRPQTVSVTRPAYLTWTADGKRMYISNTARSQIIGNITCTQQTCILEPDGSINDVSGGKVPTPFRLTPDPDNTDIFYIGFSWDGFRVFNGNTLIRSITKTDAPMPDYYNTAQVHGIDIDPEGNLWVGCLSNTENQYLVLPSSKRKDIENVVYSDWLIPNLPSSYITNCDMRACFHSKKPYAIFINGGYDAGYAVLMHNGTYTDFSDDLSIHHLKITDQSGTSNERSYVTAITEDKNGQIWMGTTEGIMVMKDPAEAMNPGYTLTRPLVARNDGTNFGDYLLASDMIFCIAVDHTNRKWIGTEASGLYLVSEDGTEIIEHFTPNNSPLPSNKVYSVSVNPNSSEVYVGTDAGVFVYNGTSSPAAEDYSDVFVYPNPVRPDYTGWITITGLMDNSLVKIADAAGNVVHTGRSEGGSMIWDGCNDSGQRVRTGVYYVLASQNSQGNSGIVAKLMVIN